MKSNCLNLFSLGCLFSDSHTLYETSKAMITFSVSLRSCENLKTLATFSDSLRSCETSRIAGCLISLAYWLSCWLVGRGWSLTCNAVVQSKQDASFLANPGQGDKQAPRGSLGWYLAIIVAKIKCFTTKIQTVHLGHSFPFSIKIPLTPLEHSGVNANSSNRSLHYDTATLQQKCNRHFRRDWRMV